LAVHLESLYAREKEASNKLYQQCGFDFDNGPTESFRKIAQHTATIIMVRSYTTINMMRFFWLDMAYQHADRIIKTSTTAQTARDAWVDFQGAVHQGVIFAGDNILKLLPFYIYPDPSNPDSPLTITSVSSLLWTLTAFNRYRSLLDRQRATAQHALYQIGRRAKLPVAIKLADSFKLDPSGYSIGYLVHLG
jgi:hypothetical protein